MRTEKFRFWFRHHRDRQLPMDLVPIGVEPTEIRDYTEAFLATPEGEILWAEAVVRRPNERFDKEEARKYALQKLTSTAKDAGIIEGADIQDIFNVYRNRNPSHKLTLSFHSKEDRDFFIKEFQKIL